MASAQFHVTTAVPPHAGAVPNEAVHDGATPVHVVLAEEVPVVPLALVAVIVQLSPAEPTPTGAEPEHGAGPLTLVDPVQVYSQRVAFEQLHVKVDGAPHAARADHEVVQLGVTTPASTTEQRPAEQVSPAPHTVPHVPQLSASEVTSTQRLLQFDCPVAQPQRPATQGVPTLHPVPQAPQLSGSEVRSTQLAPQPDRPGGHAQLPATQRLPGVQATPHAPQFCASVRVSTQTVVPAVVHIVALHELPHTPALQSCPAEHARPHAPQLARSLWRSTQLAPQRVCPVAHAQVPPRHAWPAGHARPHAPQLLASELTSTQLAPHAV